ncbi:hypothetical protein LXA43DRAFT_976077 [Ganoderma leucocontextum]|nr:hypothetical protein LXA43DRAFT_976077 [Ganoderma leucocontextum]
MWPLASRDQVCSFSKTHHTSLSSGMSLVSAFSSPGVRVRDAGELEAVCHKLSSKPSRGCVIEDLCVVLDGPFSLQALHQCLSLLPNLTDLVLLLYDPDIPALFDGVHLPKIQYVRTNAGHHTMPGFLASHPTITMLQLLTPCEADCPLDGLELPHLRWIGGPSRCVSHLVHSELPRLTLEASNSTSDPLLSLRSISTRIQSLYILTVDFHVDDYDILSTVIAACSTIRKLKLVKKPPRPQTRNSPRRAWNDGVSWSKALRKLPGLEELMLRTASPLVPGSDDDGNEFDEYRALMCWVTGVRSTGRCDRPQPHPALYHIGVWYRADDPNRNVVTHWSHRLGMWERTVMLRNRPMDYDFV